MDKKLLAGKYTAIKQLVYGHIEKSLSVYTHKAKIKCIINEKIPLYKGRDVTRILYISGIALRLSKSQNLNAMEIASAIASHLSANCGDEFSVQIVPPGLIHLVVSDPILAAWLQHLAEGRVGSGKQEKSADGGTERRKSPIQNFSRLFAVQYAHARCCSLLRLAQQEGLIQFSELNPDNSSAFWSVISSNPIAWLNCDQKLRFSHPASRRLIAELVQVVDDLECSCFTSSVNWEKAALGLSQAFESFWCNCRIWGEVKITSPELAEARLGLVMATQSVLRFLIEEKLGVFAFVEL